MDTEPSRAAVHEAGHALIASALGRRLIAVRLVPRPAVEAQRKTPVPTGRLRTDRDRALVEGEIMVHLAGLAAERVLHVADDSSLAGSLEDLGRATELSLRLSGRARAEATVAHFSSVVERMLLKRVPALRSLARALDAEGSLDEEALEAWR